MTCFAKGRHRPCYGRLTVHHILSKQRLRREHASLSAAYRRGEGPRPWSLTKALKDERNLREVCWGCHQCVEAGSIPVELSDLPEGFFEFVSEYRLAGLLPRHLMGVMAA
jgi:hypothetical protein